MRSLLLGLQAMHYVDLQGLNALLRSKVCTMLLGWAGGLHTVTVIRPPRDQQNNDCQFHLEFFPPSSLCTGSALKSRVLGECEGPPTILNPVQAEEHHKTGPLPPFRSLHCHRRRLEGRNTSLSQSVTPSACTLHWKGLSRAC